MVDLGQKQVELSTCFYFTALHKAKKMLPKNSFFEQHLNFYFLDIIYPARIFWKLHPS